jgi:hypothetical protein
MRYFEPFIPLLVVVDFTKIWQNDERPSLTNPFTPPIRCTKLRPSPFSTTDQGFERMDFEPFIPLLVVVDFTNIWQNDSPHSPIRLLPRSVVLNCDYLPLVQRFRGLNGWIVNV